MRFPLPSTKTLSMPLPVGPGGPATPAGPIGPLRLPIVSHTLFTYLKMLPVSRLINVSPHLAFAGVQHDGFWFWLKVTLEHVHSCPKLHTVSSEYMIINSLLLVYCIVWTHALWFCGLHVFPFAKHKAADGQPLCWAIWLHN